MTNEDMNTLRSLLQEEVGPLGKEVAGLRKDVTLLHEEVGSLGTEVAGLRKDVTGLSIRMDSVETSINKLEGMVIPMGEHLVLIRTGLREARSDIFSIQSTLQEAIGILDIAASKNNELQLGQITFEKRMEENMRIIKQDIIELKSELGIHEETPLDQAHPRPHSAA